MGVLDKLKKKAEARGVTTSVRFTDKDLARIDAAAEKLGTTRSLLIYESAMDVVARYERQVKTKAGAA